MAVLDFWDRNWIKKEICFFSDVNNDNNEGHDGDVKDKSVGFVAQNGKNRKQILYG